MKSKKSVYDWLDSCDHNQWSRARVIVILKSGEIVGKIQVAYPKDGAGTLRAFLWDYGQEIQMGTAGGYGYDKLSAALRGMNFKGIEIQDHPENYDIQLRKAGYQVITLL